MTFDETRMPIEDGTLDLLALDDAMSRLEQLNEDLVRVVELRYFTGMTIPETAQVLAIDPATVKRRWRTARAFLFRELDRSQDVNHG